MPVAIVKAYPPNIEQIRKAFDIADKKGIVFTWGNIIFNPDDGPIPAPLLAHEMVHVAQQGEKPDGIKLWWTKYCEDSQFRLEQESPAYQAEYLAIKHWLKDRNKLHKYLHQLAVNMSSKQYGNMIKYGEAIKLIKNEK